MKTLLSITMVLGVMGLSQRAQAAESSGMGLQQAGITEICDCARVSVLDGQQKKLDMSQIGQSIAQNCARLVSTGSGSQGSTPAPAAAGSHAASAN